LAPDAGATQAADSVIWLHEAFCSMALPMRATRGAWQRDVGTAAIRIEPGAADEPLPSGRLLRLSLMRVCDAAFRTNNPLVEFGEDAAALAGALRVDPRTRDLAEQWQRLQAARIVVSWGGGPELSVFDARIRPRVGGLAWRSGVRLNSKFLASLVEHAVPLDSRVVHDLSASPAALDAYAWLRLSLHHAPADRIITTTWDELMRRFGTASKDLAGFRDAFEAALRLVFDADQSIALAVDDDGVSVRHAAAEDDEVTADIAPPPPSGNPAAVDAAAAMAESSPAMPDPAVPLPGHAGQAASDADSAPAAGPEPLAPAAESAAAAADRITQDSISLPRHLTGLTQVIWLRRGHGEDSVLVGVTPSPRFEPERLTVLAVEPMVIQVSGGLNEKEFERVSAWVMTNRDVIDDFWEGRVISFDELNRRVRKAPAPGWR
jgi:hypothetical protein